jgi:hypothetical protein
MSSQSGPATSRRGFLKLAVLTGTAVAGGHVLYTYVPWLNYDRQSSKPGCRLGRI